MVTVNTRPQGHKIINQAISALAFSSFYFDTEENVLINFTAHGLSNGDYIYLVSDIDEYNGFWEVEVFNVNAFYLTEGGQRVEFYQEIDIEYYQTQEHDWSSIFLPIVYKVSNDLWPSNSNTIVRTVLSQSDDNGFTNLVLSGPLKSFFNPLEFVKIDGAIWQIVEVISTSEIVINMPYNAANVFTSVQYYYNNYQVKVKIYAGLPPSHPWVAKKPYTEVAELSLTPDDDNQVMFSVSDYIKIKVAIKNNLTLFSLPLNLDAFTGFYISVGESYDQSDGYSLYTSESTFADDSFEGYAIAGKLPFKNIYSGDYADYVHTSGSPARWLTNHARLLAVEGYYFDVSFIKNILGPWHINLVKYVGDYGIQETIEMTDHGIGVYRVPITPDANYDSFCITAETESYTETVEVPPTPFNLSLFQNDPSASDPWTTGAIPFILNSHNSKVLYISFPTTMGTPYRFNYKFEVNNAPPGTKYFSIATLDAIIGGITFEHIPVTSDGIYEGFVILTPSASGLYVGVTNSSSLVAFDLYFLEFSEGLPTTEEVEVPGQVITEEICIDILETCESINQFTQEARRLLEDGGYRLLE